jgi:probable F420-dependent oxidoreductase
MSVRFGVGLGTQQLLAGPDDFAEVVDSLEDLRFDSVWMSERVTGPGLDPLAALGYVAGRTRRLKFGTSVLVVPGRNPVLLAKELATLDVLGKGRLLLALGLGAVDAGEQQAFGVDRAERGPWFDEAVPLMRRLWRERDVTHDGERFHVHGLSLEPRPVGRMEAWLGGSTPAEYRRTGRLADGWLGSLQTPEEAAQARAAIEEAAGRYDRKIDDDHFGTTVLYAHDTYPQAVAALLARRRPDRAPEELVPRGDEALVSLLTAYVDAGLSKFVLVPTQPPASWRDELTWLASLVHPLQD